MPLFQKGQSGNINGRPRGVVRRPSPSAEIRQIALGCCDETYWHRIREGMRNGTLHPKIEATILSYAYGQPARDAPHSGPIITLGPLLCLQEAERPALSPNPRVSLPDILATGLPAATLKQ